MARRARAAVRALSPLLVVAAAASCSTGPSSNKPDAGSAPQNKPDPGCALSTLDHMDERAKVAQLFMAGIPATGIPPADQAALDHAAPGGVYFSGRAKSGAADVARISSGVQQRGTAAAHGVQLFVGVDQEGGKVQPLAGPGFSAIPPATEQGRWSPDQQRQAAATWGRELRSAGVNVDLAPIADTLAPDVGKENPAIGKYDRAFSTDPAVVASHVRAFIEGMRSAGVSTTAKHFPGLGAVRGNTDIQDHVVDDRTTANSPTMQPFEEGVRSGSTFMMSSSATYPKIDPANRAVFSRTTLNDLLRHQLGFKGLIISDDLGQAKEVSSVPLGQRAVDFVAAGGDVVLTASPRTVDPMIDAVIDRSHRDPQFAARVNDAERKVLEAKTAHGLMPCGK